MLQVGKQYEDARGPYEVVEVSGDKCRLRYFIGPSGFTLAVTAIKYRIHLELQEQRKLGFHPEWSTRFEQFFELLTEEGAELSVWMSPKYFDRFRDLYYEITGIELTETDHKYVGIAANDEALRTAYKVGFNSKLKPYVPSCFAVFIAHRASDTHFTCQLSSKQLFIEMLKRGWRLGRTHGNKV